MSRPFSYNDENFTVIGNILFTHVWMTNNSIAMGDTLVRIPPEIFKRMAYYNQVANVSNCNSNAGAILLGITCSNEGFIVARANLDAGSERFPRILMAWYYLKDI